MSAESPEHNQLPLCLNSAVEDVIRSLESSQLDIIKLARAFLHTPFTLVVDDSFYGRFFEKHVSLLLEELMVQGVIGYETVGGMITSSYVFDRPPRRTLQVADRNTWNNKMEIDGDFRADYKDRELRDGKYLIGVVEVKNDTVIRNINQAVNLKRIRRLSDAFAEFAAEEDDCAVGWVHILAIPKDLDMRGIDGSGMKDYEKRGGIVAVLPITREEVRTAVSVVQRIKLERLRLVKGIRKSMFGY